MLYIKGNLLLKWLTGCGVESPSVAVSQQRGQLSGSCPFHETGCLSSPYLVLEFPRIPRKLQVSSECQNSAKRWVLTPVKECLRSSKSESKQAKARTSLFHILL